jgi:hypothetical protein
MTAVKAQTATTAVLLGVLVLGVSKKRPDYRQIDDLGIG